MQNIEASPRWQATDREFSSPKVRPIPIFPEGLIRRHGTLIDAPSLVDLSKIKDPATLTGYLYEEAYIEDLRANHRSDRLTITSHVIDRAASTLSGVHGMSDMLEFEVVETQGGFLEAHLRGMAEARSSSMRRPNTLKRGSGFLRRSESNGFLLWLLRSVGENVGRVVVPENRREIDFTFVTPNPPEADDPNGSEMLAPDVPRFSVHYKGIPLPKIPVELQSSLAA